MHKGGGIVWVRLSVAALLGEGNDTRCHLAMIQDITDLKQAEANLQYEMDKSNTLLDNLPLRSLQQSG